MNKEEAKKQIFEAHKLRAIMYYYIYDEIEKEYGEDIAQQIFKKATYRRGKDLQKGYEQFLKDTNFQVLAEYFCASSPSEGDIFHPHIEKIENDRAVLTMSSCPLVAAWKELGLSEEKIKILCDVSSHVDFGTFESEETELVFTHQIGSGNEKCRLIIQKRRVER
jgi:predicted ArsR family transcriptional regulator